MIPTSWIAGLAAAATLVSASTDELQLFSRLLKRQEPGTPAYNCHDNCGQAIIQARQSADVCSDDVFLTDYQNCLQCSGPDNENIWRFYGNTLSSAGSGCGLSTEPLSGDQPDVGAANPAGSSSAPSSSSADEPAPSTTSAASSTTDAESATTTAAETTGEATTEPTSAGSAPTATGEPSSSSAASEESSAAVTSASATPAPTATTTGGVNGTSPSTTASETAVVTAAANALSVGGVAFYGALAFGAFYVAGQ